MNCSGASLLRIVALLGSLSVPVSASAESSQYALDRLFLIHGASTPLDEVLSFDSITEVENYYGIKSKEAHLAKDFFADSTGSSANMLFARLPASSGARSHLYGSDISSLTAQQLQTFNGSLSIISQGYQYYAPSINLAGQSFSTAANVIQTALNKTLPIAAVTTGTIAPVSVSFNGSINATVLTVSGLSSGSIQIGSYISGPGVPPDAQVTSQINGTPNGVGTYGLYLNEPSVSTETLTESYGVLTVNSVGSGTVAVGQEIAGLPLTAIEANLSGSGAAGTSTWVVNNAQSVATQAMTMTGAPLSVKYNTVSGATSKRDFFTIQQNGNFNWASSSITYAGGTLAGSLGLTQTAGAVLSSPGEVVIPGTCPLQGLCMSPADYMNNFLQNYSDQFSSFQTTDYPTSAYPPGLQAALEAWARSTGGQYDYLQYWSANTPSIVKSMVASDARLLATAPEPSSWTMMVLGFAIVGLVRYRTKTIKQSAPTRGPAP